jgi:hypothetical protein
LKIIKAAPDLSSLWNFIDASPIMAVVFNTYAVEIVDAVITTTVPIQIQCLMRAVLRVQASSVVSCYYHSLSETRNLSLKSSNPLERAEIETPELLHRFGSLAHKIHMLAHSCINHYIQRSMVMTPSSLIKLGPYDGGFVGSDMLAFDGAESQPYQPHNTGPPSWVEEQRVVKALWRIQFLSELKLARSEGRLNWTGDDLKALESTSLINFYSIKPWDLEQILTAWEFLQELRAREGVNVDSISQLPTASLGESFNHNCAPQPCLDSKDDHFQQREEYLDLALMSYIFHISFIARDPKFSPLRGMPFKPYRKFGFAIWDDKRMTDLGFAEPRKRVILHTLKYYYVWYSVLTDEERMLRDS